MTKIRQGDSRHRNRNAQYLLGPSSKDFQALRSFEPICKLVDAPNVIVVNSVLPYRTLAELMNAARVKPGDLMMASIGPASNQYIAIARQKRTSNIETRCWAST
jgi:tripartite-type tricarboxylate transporter receptor subunit TctC